MDAASDTRLPVIVDEIRRVDGIDILSEEGTAKHRDMAGSPFDFFRGTASLFYRDLKDGRLAVDVARPSLTRIQGDCHLENFGFLTEGGAWAAPHHVVFCPNDFDDAGVGHAEWDLMRYAVSLFLAADRASCDEGGAYGGGPLDQGAGAPGFKAARKAAKSFLKRYRKTCREIARRPDDCWDEVVCDLGPGNFLARFEKKAKRRAVGGKDFARKSRLARAVDLASAVPRFRHEPGRLERLLGQRAATIVAAFRPYVDDMVCDVAIRFGAGLGARDADRYYLLVGPDADARAGTDWRRLLELYHIVEIKAQRPAAFLAHFPEIDPANRMPPAHLVVDCQRLMQRRPDRILDAVEWNATHWLVRTRHHSKVSVNAQDLADGDLQDNLVDHAKASARAIALAHGRADKRSRRFECHMVERLSGGTIAHMVGEAEAHATQVMRDWALMARAR